MSPAATQLTNAIGEFLKYGIVLFASVVFVLAIYLARQPTPFVARWLLGMLAISALYSVVVYSALIFSRIDFMLAQFGQVIARPGTFILFGTLAAITVYLTFPKLRSRK